jgi:hypothetical protein
VIETPQDTRTKLAADEKIEAFVAKRVLPKEIVPLRLVGIAHHATSEEVRIGEVTRELVNRSPHDFGRLQHNGLH